MTVESNVVTAGPFEGNGVTETFSFGFAIMSASDLLVYHYDSDDTPSLLVKDTDYSVSGIGDSEGGSITLLTGALATGESLRLRSNYDLTQSASFPSQGRFYPEDHEKVMDSLARQIQQLNYEFSRLSTSSQEPTSLPAVTAGTVAAGTVAADTVTADTVTADTVSAQVLDAESFSGRAIDEFISTFEGVEGVLPLSTPRLFGDGTTTDFAVSVPSGAVFQSAFYVNISGNKQRHTFDFIYSNANSQLEFVTAPPDGAAIDVIYFSPASIDPSSVPVRPVVDIATLRNTEPQSATDQILLLGHTTPGVGGGVFRASSTTDADDSGVTIETSGGAKWVRALNGYVTPEMFGSTGNVLTDNGAILACNDYQGLIRVEPNKIYYMSEGLTIDVSKTLFSGSNSRFDFSNATPPYSGITLISSDSSGEPYQNNGGGTNGISFRGNGKDLAGDYQADVFCTVSAPSAAKASAGSSIRNGTASLFGKGVEVKNNGYNVKFENFNIFRCGVDVEMLSGQGNNYGEKVVFDGCVLFNSDLAIRMGNGAGGLFFKNCSMDYNAKTIEQTGGVVHMQGCHVEFDNEVLVSAFDVSGESFCTMDGGWLQTTGGAWLTDYCVESNDNATVIFDKVRMINIQPLVSFDSGDGRVVTENTYLNPVSNMQGVRGSSELKDPSFEENNINENLVFISSDAPSVTDIHIGSNIELSVSSVISKSGTYSLRAAKEGGAGSNAALIIAVPANEGDTFAFDLSVIDNNSRDGDVFITSHFGSITSFNGNGVPENTRSSALTSTTFSSNGAWTDVSSGLNGSTDRACPSWANYFFIRFNMNSFEGGVDAPEGGNYSIYIDDVNIYKW